MYVSECERDYHCNDCTHPAIARIHDAYFAVPAELKILLGVVCGNDKRLVLVRVFAMQHRHGTPRLSGMGESRRFAATVSRQHQRAAHALNALTAAGRGLQSNFSMLHRTNSKQLQKI